MSETHSHRGATPARSWRRVVADALTLAQSAVELDTTKTDRVGALLAYTESVQRLRSIRARLERHGAHAEARQLAKIVRLTFSRDYLRSDQIQCDKYTERMRQLSVACTVPPPPYEYQPSQSPVGGDYYPLLVSPSAYPIDAPPAYTAEPSHRLPQEKIPLQS